MSVSMIDSGGNSVSIFTVAMPDGSKSAGHVLVDANGVPYSATHPLLTAPAILAVTPVDHSSPLAPTTGSSVDIAANPVRKGGTILAGPNNGGLVTVTLKNADGTTHVRSLAQGIEFLLTINGYVIQTEVTITAVGSDTFQAVEYV